MRIILNNGRAFWVFVTHSDFESVTRYTNVTPKPAPVLDCNRVTDRTGENSEKNKKAYFDEPVDTELGDFINELNQEHQSNAEGNNSSKGIDLAELKREVLQEIETMQIPEAVMTFGGNQ